jgi:hypothetical protein
MFITKPKPKPRRAGLVSLSALALLIAIEGLFHVWAKVGRDEDRRERIAALALEDLGGAVQYEDLNEKREEASKRFENAGENDFYKPGINPWVLNNRWLWPVPWWSARRWTPAAFIGREVPFTSHEAVVVSGKLIEPQTDVENSPQRVVVEAVFGADDPMTDAQWDRFCRWFPATSRLEIGCPFNDEQLRFLKHMRNLNLLRLFADEQQTPPFTGEGLIHLRSMPRLRAVELHNVRLSEKGKEALGRLDNIRCLVLGGAAENGDERWRPDANNDVLAHLSGLTRLENLNVTNVTDAGLVHLRKLPSLHYLTLSDAAVTDDGLRHLAGLGIRRLYLFHSKISDRGIVHLARLPELRELSLSGTKVTEAAIPDLQKLKNLRSLDLTNTRFTDAGRRKVFNGMPTLEHLDLSGWPYMLGRGPERRQQPGK